MHKKLWFFFLLLWSASPCIAFEKMSEIYCISYGDPNAPIEVVEYFSFSCPKCLDVYQEGFAKLKRKYIDSGKVQWIFHPDPVDLPTLEAMVCLEGLGKEQKQLFFESLFEALKPSALHKSPMLMKKAMEYFKKPEPRLEEMEYLESTAAFQAAFQFLKQNPPIEAVPSIEIQGKICVEMPTYDFVSEQIEKLIKENQ